MSVSGERFGNEVYERGGSDLMKCPKDRLAESGPNARNDAALQQLLLDLGQQLGVTSAESDILSLLAERLLEIFPCSHTALWIREADANELRCLVACPPGDNVWADPVGQCVPLDPLPPVLTCTPSVVLDDPERISATFAHLTPFLPGNTQSAVAAVFGYGRNGIGLLYMSTDIPGRVFEADDALYLSALSGYARMGLLNADLRQWQHMFLERRRRLDLIRHYLVQTLDLDVLVPRLFDQVNRELMVEGQSLWLLDPMTKQLHCPYAIGPGASQMKSVSFAVGEGIVGTTVARLETIHVADAQSDSRHSRRTDRITGQVTQSLLSVPLVREGKGIGAIQAMNKRAGQFSEEDRELLRGIADIAALAIANAQLYAALQASYDTTLEALTAALDARDHETEGHSRRVVEYAARLARQIGMSEEEVVTLRRGAMLHDIGKLAIPDAILHKPGSLTPMEQAVMREHPRRGYEMLRDIRYLKHEREIVLAHQERWDGSGYPNGLVGEQIPLAARVFMIADTLDAILSDRPYRKGQDYKAARRIIEMEAGRQFDPRLVESFLTIPAEDWEFLRVSVDTTEVLG
jgi:putative nucleotidyltransferase with HDIG domain